MKNSLLKFSSLLLIAASLVFTSCKKDEPAPVTQDPNALNVPDGKVGLKLSNSTSTWLGDEIVKAVYNPTSRLLDIEAVKYETGTKVVNSKIIIAITLDRTTPNKTYTANFNPNNSTGDIIFYGSPISYTNYINGAEYSSVGEYTVSNFSAASKKATVSIKNLVFTLNGSAVTVTEGKFNNVTFK
jgi:hypothetical protein